MRRSELVDVIAFPIIRNYFCANAIPIQEMEQASHVYRLCPKVGLPGTSPTVKKAQLQLTRSPANGRANARRSASQQGDSRTSRNTAKPRSSPGRELIIAKRGVSSMPPAGSPHAT